MSTNTTNTPNEHDEKLELLGVEYLRQKAVADLLGKSRQTIGRWIARGEITATKLGREWIIKPESLREYLDEKTRIGRAKI